jgi:hypothetical protein
LGEEASINKQAAFLYPDAKSSFKQKFRLKRGKKSFSIENFQICCSKLKKNW